MTRFHYSAPVSESVTEVRKRPLQEEWQRRVKFDLVTNPAAQVTSYQDHWGNTVHQFNILPLHLRLEMVAQATVEVALAEPLDLDRFSAASWDVYPALRQSGRFWDFLNTSRYIEFDPAVFEFANNQGFAPGGDEDPLSLARRLMGLIYDRFDYRQDTTTVNSRVDELLRKGAGVCQDFTHLMIAVLRQMGLPSRYVSGYLMHRDDYNDRAAVDASHAWVEVWLPHGQWVGFDPTNNLIAQERHIRVAIGRDYADVPPTKGVFTGEAESELMVSVEVKQIDGWPAEQIEIRPATTAWASQEPVQLKQLQQIQQQQ